MLHIGWVTIPKKLRWFVKEKARSKDRAFSFGIRQRPTLPGVRHGLSLRPPGAAHGSPSQVQCCTWLEMIRIGRAFPVLCTRKRTQQMLSPFSCGIRQRPTLPGRLQPSTIGAERLNFCVRYGNRWIPFAIVTGMLSRVCAVLRLLGFGSVIL